MNDHDAYSMASDDQLITNYICYRYFRITKTLGWGELGVVKQRIGYAGKLGSTLVDISVSNKK